MEKEFGIPIANMSQKVLLVIVDEVNEPTLREFLYLGGYQFSVAYIQPPASAGKESI